VILRPRFRLLIVVVCLAVAACAVRTAEGQPDEVTLTVTLLGGGHVEIEPAGVGCTSSCSHRLPAGTAVTLVADARSGLVGSWRGACQGARGDSCELTLAGDTSVTVTFLAAFRPRPVPTAPSQTETTPPDETAAPPRRQTTPPVTTHHSNRPEPPPPAATPGQKAIDSAIENLPIGRIEFNTPPTLKLGETATIHLVLSLRETHEQLRGRISEIGETAGGEVRVSDDMEAKLLSAQFEIKPLGDERKPVSAEDTTEWFWQIKPIETGVLELRITLSAFVRVAGEEKKREIKVFSKKLEIRVTWLDRASAFVGGNWQWLWTTIAVPAAAWMIARRRGRLAG
jgi:hypothetical protein